MADHDRDLELAQEIVAGSVDAWHTFIHEYSGLILSVVRRHVYGDEDEIRTVFTTVLEGLYTQALRGYEGRASLATWLALIARGRALDHVRRKLGRRRIPPAIAELGPLEQRMFQLYHLEGLTIPAVRHRLGTEAMPSDLETVLAAVDTVEQHLDPHLRRRLAYGCTAAQLQGVSGRLLEFADEELARTREHDRAHAADTNLRREEEARKCRRLRTLLNRLPQEEQQVLRLRFEEEKSAREIATELDLESPRRVYTIVERSLARLRQWIDTSEPDSG